MDSLAGQQLLHHRLESCSASRHPLKYNRAQYTLGCLLAASHVGLCTSDQSFLLHLVRTFRSIRRSS